LDGKRRFGVDLGEETTNRVFIRHRRPSHVEGGVDSRQWGPDPVTQTDL
jgi:hypothetical protein